MVGNDLEQFLWQMLISIIVVNETFDQMRRVRDLMKRECKEVTFAEFPVNSRHILTYTC